MASAFETETNLPVQNFFNSPNQEQYVPLSVILDNAIQRTYHQLILMIDMFPGTSDRERKIKLVAFACKTRLLFMRLYALVKFIRTAHINVSNILSFLDQQSFIFVDTADFLYHLAKEKLVNARLPIFPILTSVDVLTLGTYTKLPSCIKERILPVEKISTEDKESTLQNLNRIVQCRLALSEVPGQMRHFKIEKGHVKFTVKNEFEVKLTLMSDNFKMPWRLLGLKILVKDSQDPNQPLVHNLQKDYIQQIVQMRLNENNKPLVDMYKSLHFFAQSLQLEVLFQQMNMLNRLTFGKFYKIHEYQNWKKLTVKYWLEYSQRNQYDFKFTILVGENSDFLQTFHYPPIHWKDHKNIDMIFKSDELLIEKIVHETIKFRSKKRLVELQSAFENVKYCKATLFEDKPALQVQFFINKLENQSFWIFIDYYSGLFQIVMLKQFTNSILKNNIEQSINTDLKNLQTHLSHLRVWLLLKRCESLAQTYGYKCFKELFIASFGNNELSTYFSKLEKHRLFIELPNHERVYVMLTIRTKEDLSGSDEQINWYENAEFLENEHFLSLNYYILNVAKCKFDGEVDATKPFLKLMSISQFPKIAAQKFKQQENNLKAIKTLKYSKKNEENKDDYVEEFLNMLSYIDQQLPFMNFIANLNKQNIVTQNIQQNPEMMPIKSLNVISEPTFTQNDMVDYEEIEKTSAQLWKSLLSLTIRNRKFKDYLNTTVPILSYTKTSSLTQLFRFNFTIELTFNRGIFSDPVLSLDTQLQQHQQQHQYVDVYNVDIQISDLDAFYQRVKLEWIAICRMYTLVKQVKNALSRYAEYFKNIRIKEMNFHKLTLNYGPNFTYTIQFKWSQETKFYDVLFGIEKFNSTKSHYDTPTVNYHLYFVNEIKKYFSSNQSVMNLMQLLNQTCVTSFALYKFTNFPKFFAKPTITNALSMPGFITIVYSLTHFKIVYFSKYCLDVNIKQNGLIAIRDGSFSLTELNHIVDELQPIQYLNSFLNLFVDENLEELLKSKSSNFDEEEFNQSPTTSSAPSTLAHQNNTNTGYTYPSSVPSNSQHVFLPPTSPVIQSRLNTQIPTPTMQNYFVQSPAPSSNLPANAQSPGFTNFGSPALPHNSPTINQQNSVQSPSTAFLSPAPGNQNTHNHSIQSPANFLDISMASPAAQPSVPIRSPYVGPSPASTNIPTPGYQSKETIDDQTAKLLNQKPASQNPSNPSSVLSNQMGQTTRKHSSSAIIYLSELGFLRMIKCDQENYSYSPIEIFLITSHMKKKMLKELMNDPINYLAKNTDLNIFKTHFFEFQITNEVSANYNAFSLIFNQVNEIPTEIMHKYFHSRILAAPYKSSNTLAFLNLLALNDMKLYKDLIQLFEYEMNPSMYKFQWRPRFNWTMPSGYHSIKNPKSALFGHYQSSNLGFYRKDKYFFIMIQLCNQSRLSNPNSLGSILLLLGYDTVSNIIHHELLRPIGDNNKIYNDYESYIGSIFMNKQKDINNLSLFSVVYDLLTQLPSSFGPIQQRNQ